jgi:hypothetical protein
MLSCPDQVYLRHILNPFNSKHDPITSLAFDERVKLTGKKFLLQR